MDAESTNASRAAALAYLHGRIDYERAPAIPYNARDLRLGRMRELLDRLGNPEAGLPIIHVAGTKGKGSTSAMIAAALTAAGIRTGVFSSPHLQQLEERFSVDGSQCTATELVNLVEQVRPAAAAMDALEYEQCSPTYFELTTAMALLHFRAAGAQAVVLEVGMGGRLDSTNVCTPCVTVITSISFDHTRQLGNTLREIAHEKAGIVKNGIPLISGVMQPEPAAEIARICAERGSALHVLGQDFLMDYLPATDAMTLPAIDFQDQHGGALARLAAVRLAQLGRHQGENAAVALATLAELVRQGWEIPESAVRQGLSQLRMPARIEVLQTAPLLILDAAHNVASVRALLETLNESFAAPRRRWLILATSRDKDLRGMLAELMPAFDRVLLTLYTVNPRGESPRHLQQLATELGYHHAEVYPNLEAAWRVVADEAAREDLVCLTGSFFMAAEMPAIIRANPFADRG